jgi:hypothetical protein
VKATFQIPDELYREVKAQTAREGRTVREVTIGLFEQWLRQKKQPSPLAPPVDWQNFQPPLAHLVPPDVTEHGVEAMRESVVRDWDEQA